MNQPRRHATSSRRALRALPEVTFMRILPSDVLLAAVREQDERYHSLLGADPVANRVLLQKRENGTHRVEVSRPGSPLSAEAEHPEVEWAIREAYTALAHQAVNAARGTAVA
jgi:hypothetical protein